MSTDRELLELAAKAAGIYEEWPEPDYDVTWNGSGLWCSGMGCGEIWNPLTDDGDALRLAVKLHIDILLRSLTLAQAIGLPPAQAYGEAERGDDAFAASRRAIVRAAAEIGKHSAPSKEES